MNDNHTHWTAARWFSELSVLVILASALWVFVNVACAVVGVA